MLEFKKTLSFASAKRLHALGKLFTETIQPSNLIYLTGPLGAGKTCFVQGFAKALGIVEVVKSPSFSLVETYTSGNGTSLLHCDFYRLGGQTDRCLVDTIQEALDDQAIVFIEWPDLLSGAAFAPMHKLIFEIPDWHLSHRRLLHWYTDPS